MKHPITAAAVALLLPIAAMAAEPQPVLPPNPTDRQCQKFLNDFWRQNERKPGFADAMTVLMTTGPCAEAFARGVHQQQEACRSVTPVSCSSESRSMLRS